VGWAKGGKGGVKGAGRYLRSHVGAKHEEEEVVVKGMGLLASTMQVMCRSSGRQRGK
jgi:hypothetical protein